MAFFPSVRILDVTKIDLEKKIFSSEPIVFRTGLFTSSHYCGSKTIDLYKEQIFGEDLINRLGMQNDSCAQFLLGSSLLLTEDISEQFNALPTINLGSEVEGNLVYEKNESKKEMTGIYRIVYLGNSNSSLYFCQFYQDQTEVVRQIMEYPILQKQLARFDSNFVVGKDVTVSFMDSFKTAFHPSINKVLLSELIATARSKRTIKEMELSIRLAYIKRDGTRNEIMSFSPRTVRYSENQ